MLRPFRLVARFVQADLEDEFVLGAAVPQVDFVLKVLGLFREGHGDGSNFADSAGRVEPGGIFRVDDNGFYGIVRQPAASLAVLPIPAVEADRTARGAEPDAAIGRGR